MAKVHKLKRGHTTYLIPETAMNELRLRLYEDSAKDIAKAMGVSAGCVYAIRGGRTQWPRGRTFFALLEYCGVEMHLYDVDAREYL